MITPDSKTVYIDSPAGKDTVVTPISTATNTAGPPLPVAPAGVIGITPGGKILYAAADGKIIPVSTAANKPGRPIPVRGYPSALVIAP